MLFNTRICKLLVINSKIKCKFPNLTHDGKLVPHWNSLFDSVLREKYDLSRTRKYNIMILSFRTSTNRVDVFLYANFRPECRNLVAVLKNWR